jgi:hypothetical protein
MVFCTECGHEQTDDQKFCRYCGERMPGAMLMRQLREEQSAIAKVQGVQVSPTQTATQQTIQNVQQVQQHSNQVLPPEQRPMNNNHVKNNQSATNNMLRDLANGD